KPTTSPESGSSNSQVSLLPPKGPFGVTFRFLATCSLSSGESRSQATICSSELPVESAEGGGLLACEEAGPILSPAIERPSSESHAAQTISPANTITKEVARRASRCVTGSPKKTRC